MTMTLNPSEHEPHIQPRDSLTKGEEVGSNLVELPAPFEQLLFVKQAAAEVSDRFLAAVDEIASDIRYRLCILSVLMGSEGFEFYFQKIARHYHIEMHQLRGNEQLQLPDFVINSQFLMSHLAASLFKSEERRRLQSDGSYAIEDGFALKVVSAADLLFTRDLM
jgi:hypothetical protein